MRTKNMVIGVASAALAGAAIGMLFAPRKGSDTRQQIADRSNEYMNGTKTRFNSMINGVSSKLDSVKSKALGKKRQMESEVSHNNDGYEKIVY